MLDPNQRHVYLQALRPPTGYRLDRAIATTYSLDLTALLVVPLSMALFPCEEAGRSLRDPVAVLEALRRNADRLTIFCQRGATHAPDLQHLLYSELEKMVVEVQPPARAEQRGVFHPKIWVLRYADDDGRVRYRVLCLTRNLTFDRSWDTLFAIEGDLALDAPEIERNAPLADFVAALPPLAIEPLDDPRSRTVARIADEVRRAALQLPDGGPFNPESVRFKPLGLTDDSAWPFRASMDRLLVVSPFVSAGSLSDLANGVSEVILISRQESLQAVGPSALQPFEKIYVLDETVEDVDAVAPGVEDEAGRPVTDEDAGRDVPGSEAAESEAVEGETAEGDTATNDDAVLDAAGADDVAGDDAEERAGSSGGVRDEFQAGGAGGLHAKLYVGEAGDRAWVWTGSANATVAALPDPSGSAAPHRGRNIEFLVELQGDRDRVGIDAVLGEGDDADGNLFSMIRPWRPKDEATEEERRQAELDQRRNQLRIAWAALDLRLRVEPTDGDRHRIVLLAHERIDPGPWTDASIRAWPVTQKELRAKELDIERLGEQQGTGLTIATVATPSVTRFIVFEIHVSEDAVEGDALTSSTRFVLNLPATGVPEDRSKQIVRALIGDREAFVQYLVFLLSEGEAGGALADELLAATSEDARRNGHGRANVLPLFEDLVRALASSPEKIARIGQLVADLRDTDDGKSRIPDGFDDIWHPIEAAWREHFDQ